MKNYTTMKNYLIVVLAVLGLTACKESKVEPQSIIRHKKKTSVKDVCGWNMGLEPMTLGTTIRCSTN